MTVMMTLNDYQDRAVSTAIYPDCGEHTMDALNYTLVGLAGGTGTVSTLWRKVLGSERDYDDVTRCLLGGQLGTVLWHLAAAAREIGMTLEEVAAENLGEIAAKLAMAADADIRAESDPGPGPGPGPDSGTIHSPDQLVLDFNQDVTATTATAQTAPVSHDTSNTDCNCEGCQTHRNLVKAVVNSITRLVRQHGGNGRDVVEFAGLVLAAVLASTVKPKMLPVVEHATFEMISQAVPKFSQDWLEDMLPMSRA